MRAWVAWTIGAALIVAAWGVSFITPVEDATVVPFPVAVSLNEPGVGRNIAATVTDVQRADSVTAGGWSAEGNWLVVDLDAATVVSDSDASLRLTTLEIGGLTIQASERPESFFEGSLSTGIPRSGSLAFELPDSIDSGTAVLRLGLRADPRLDSIIVVEFELGELAPEARVELSMTDWSTR